MEKYNHKKIEKKWQEKWEKDKLYEALDNSSKKKYYALIEFPYPSGDGLHVGHPRPYIGLDIIARKRRAEGYNVLYPIGWDAFGLPTENYAIKTGIHPKVVTKKNTDIFRRQIKSLGLSFDWTREINTTDPEYYKWTQWIFLHLFKNGLAYKKNMPINWCIDCKIGLANEESVNAVCQRCGGGIEKREKEQWMLAITKYAARLDKDLDTVDYAEPIKIQQRNWIGKSEGAEIEFKISNSEFGVKVFTTRPDTLFGAAYLVLAPEHELIQNLEPRILNIEEADAYIKKAKEKSDIDKVANGKDKTGVELKGVKAINPATKEEIPIFVADYALAQYGTGAIMAVPAHDQRDYEFAKINNLEIRTVIRAERANCVIIHGCPSPDESSYNAEKRTYDKHWIPWLKKHLENRGIPARVPLMPEPWMPDYEKWKKEFEKLDVNRDTILLGHSCGASFLVRWLSETGRDISRLILVAPSKDSCEDKDVREKFYACDVDEKIRKQVSDVVIFIADNGQDANKKTARFFHKKLGGELRELKGMGHFTQEDMGTNEFPELLRTILNENEAYTGEGKLINSGKYDGLSSGEAKRQITEFVGGKMTTTYKLRDWVFSRQRYWGEPIPLVFCETCKKQAENNESRIKNQEYNKGELLNPGWIAVPEKELPVELPDVKDYKPADTGESPLANVDEWVNVKCPECGGDAKRETDVMPNWAGSSWYFLAYALGYQKSKIKNQKSFWDKKKIKYWLPVDWYNGGMEHTTLHLLYSRFWHKFLYDIKIVPTLEPYQKRTSHGLILAESGEKMSKSKGNVVNPDEIVENVGADSLRVYEMFMGPFDQAISWSADGVIGARRFIEKIWRLQSKVTDDKEIQDTSYKFTPLERSNHSGLQALLHKTIKKVSEDIEAMKFNTAVSSMMILVNEMEKEESILRKFYSSLLILLAPFAPHIAQELWEKLGNSKSISSERWPQYDNAKIAEETVKIVVQINGKVRGTICVKRDASEAYIKKEALELQNIKKWTEGGKIKNTIYIKGRLLNIVV